MLFLRSVFTSYVVDLCYLFVIGSYGQCAFTFSTQHLWSIRLYVLVEISDFSFHPERSKIQLIYCFSFLKKKIWLFQTRRKGKGAMHWKGKRSIKMKWKKIWRCIFFFEKTKESRKTYIMFRLSELVQKHVC